MALTYKQQLWLEYFLGSANGNATEAARKAGYAGNDQVLSQMGADNLAHPAIAAIIKGKVDALAMTADECLALLAEIARLPVEMFASLGKDAKLSLSDKVRALELIGKYHRLFVDRTESTTTEHKRIEIVSIQAVIPSTTTRETLTIDAPAWETPPG